LYIIWHFSLVGFNILSLSSVSWITMSLSVFLFGLSCLGLSVLPGLDYFLFHVRELFSYYLFKYFLRSFFSLFSFWDPIVQMSVCLMLSQRSLRLSFFFFFSPFFFRYSVLHSVLQVIYPCFRLSYSAIDSF